MKSLKNPFYPAFVLLCVIVVFQSYTLHSHRSNAQVNEVNPLREHLIPLKAAVQLTAAFRREKVVLNRQLRDSLYLQKSFNLPFAEKFNKEAITALMSQEGVKSVRIYLGKDGRGLIRLVLVAVDAKGNDITHITNKTHHTEDAIILETGQRCPTICSIGSDLLR